MNVYDSLYDSIDEDTQKNIKFLFKDESIKVEMIKVQKQCGGDDCGLYAIANAMQLAKKRSITGKILSVSDEITSNQLF